MIHIWKKKWAWAALLPVLLALLVFFLTAPEKIAQSLTDTIANQSLSATLTQAGAKSWNSVCWLGDPKGRFLKQFRGTSSNPWVRWQENQRTRLWSSNKSCFETSTQAIVMIFPFDADVYSLPPPESQQLQAEASELLSQTGRGLDHHRNNSTFYLQTGAQMIIFSRKDLSESSAKSSSAATD